MNIRPACQADIPRLDDLLYQVHQLHHNGRPDLFRDGCKKYTDEELSQILRDPSAPIFVAENEVGLVVGYCFTQLEEIAEGGSLVPRKMLYIDDLCVDEACRGQHIGTALYRYTLEQARLMGCYHVTLNVWTLNPAALAFYEKCGMKPLKTVMETVL